MLIRVFLRKAGKADGYSSLVLQAFATNGNTKKQHKRHGESKIGYAWGFVVSLQQTEVGVTGSASAPLWPRLRSPCEEPSIKAFVKGLSASPGVVVF